jgi:hypothetical protein
MLFPSSAGKFGGPGRNRLHAAGDGQLAKLARTRPRRSGAAPGRLLSELGDCPQVLMGELPEAVGHATAADTLPQWTRQNHCQLRLRGERLQDMQWGTSEGSETRAEQRTGEKVS